MFKIKKRMTKSVAFLQYLKSCTADLELAAVSLLLSLLFLT